MRKFSSYGPVDPELHYYAPRTGMIDRAYNQLTGEDPEKGGHYITVWAPRQTGKSWLMLEVVKRLKKTEEFDAAIISMESAKYEKSETTVLEILSRELSATLGKDFPKIDSWKNFPLLFTPEYLSKPLILIIDEFDAIEENFINKFASESLPEINRDEQDIQDNFFKILYILYIPVKIVCMFSIAIWYKAGLKQRAG